MYDFALFCPVLARAKLSISIVACPEQIREPHGAWKDLMVSALSTIAWVEMSPTPHGA
jgi:hypothetical protein